MIRVVVDDLASIAADALVRPATATLDPVSPTLDRLERLGAPGFRRRSTTELALDVGAAVVTDGGDLPAELIIHAVVTSSDRPVSSEGVRRALVSTLQRANDWQLGHVALPPLGAGEGDLTLEDAASVVAEVLVIGLTGVDYPKDVSIVVETDEARAIFEAALARFLQ